METLHLVAGWVIVGFMAVFALVISYKMIVGGPNGIDLRYLISEVQSFLLKKLAGGDKVLFRGSRKFTMDDLPEAAEANKELEIKGFGTGKKAKGNYRIGFSLSQRSSE